MAVYGDMVEPVWLFQPMSAEIYDSLPENECKGIEVVDGMIRPHPSSPLQKDMSSRICDAIEAAGTPAWLATISVDLRLSASP